MLESNKGFFGHLLTVVGVVVAAVLVMIYLLMLSGANLSLSSPYTVKAVVPEAGSLTEGSTVTMAGVDVGTVESVQRHGVGAVATIEITDKRDEPLPADSTAELKVRTPLGENYVQIVPGNSRQKLSSGSLVPATPDQNYVDVDTLLSTLQNGTRAKAQEMIDALGAAVQNQGAPLHQTLSDTNTLLVDGSNITDTLVGERQTIAQIVRQLGDITDAIGQRDASIQEIADQGLITVKAIGSRDDAVRQILTDLPGLLTQVKSTTATLQNVSVDATPVVANLATAVNQLKPTVTALVPATQEGQKVVRDLGLAEKPLEGTLNALTRASGPVNDALPEVKSVLCQVNPMLRYVQPYTRDVVSFAVGLGNASDSFDGVGHTIRLMPVLDDESFYGLPASVNGSLQTLVHDGLFQKVLPLTYDPFPKPGLNNTTAPVDSSIDGPAALKASGFKYTRVTADCK